ncbi:hypothetical protein LNQ03_02930 [Klebsiella pneumoniae subsp. pneumoniae]|nr:hypothetical protein [Klebsiella pneumoniae subsp. pneumoniae]
MVTVPANDDARIDVIKSKLSHGDLPSLPEFEKFLRGGRFPRKSVRCGRLPRTVLSALDRVSPGAKTAKPKRLLRRCASN